MLRSVRRCVLVAMTAALAACGTQRPAPVVDRTGAQPTRPATPVVPAPAARVAKDGVYAVQRGDTLYSVAQSFGVDARELAGWNNLSDMAVLTIGQTLRVVPPAQTATVTPVAPAGAPEVRPLPGAGAEPTPAPAPPAALPPLPPAAAAKPDVAPAAPVAAAVQWQWPAPGKLIDTFDESRSKGIDIAGNDGDPVAAAADGEVVYVGSALRGYGNLVIVKHSDEFISAYAHNRQILVKQGQAVKRGQKIAEFGRSDADRTKLHFEVRRQGKPVDPLKYLPAR